MHKVISSKSILFLIIALLFRKEIYSQEIIFCKGITENGEPISIISNRKLELKQKIYILLRVKNNFSENICYLNIKSHDDHNQNNIFNTLIYLDKNKNWTAYNYQFTQAGSYEISFINFNGKKIASAFLLVSSPENKNFIGISEHEIYPNIKIIFCDKIKDNKPINIREKISIKNHSGETYIYLISNRPLNSEILLVRIWKKKNIKSFYDEFVDSKKYNIQSDWYDTYFKYRFTSPGEYKIDFYNDKDLLIRTAYITVEN